jgi:nicotinamidase-related amidase
MSNVAFEKEVTTARKAGFTLRRFRKQHGSNEVTVIKDATASYSDMEMRAALDVNIPNNASAIVTTDEIADTISFISTGGQEGK